MTIKYAVLKDATVEQILDFAKKNPEVFVFPFVTVDVDKCPNYKSLFKYGDTVRAFIAQPVYIGNMKPIQNAINEIVRISLGCDISELEEVGVKS